MFFTKIIDWIDPIKVVGIIAIILALIVFFGYMLPDVGFGNGITLIAWIALIIGAILSPFAIKALLVKSVQKGLNWTEEEANETISEAFKWMFGLIATGAILGFLFAGWGPGNPMRFIESPYGFADPRITKLWLAGAIWGLILEAFIGAAIIYLKLFYGKTKVEPQQDQQPKMPPINVNTAKDAELAQVFILKEIQRIYINRNASANCGHPGQKPYYCIGDLWTATDPDGFRPEITLQGDRRLEISEKLSSHELQFEF